MDPFGQVMIRQVTELTARCAQFIHCEYCGGMSLSEIAERYGIDESTVVWWMRIEGLDRPLDAPAVFSDPAPTQFKISRRD
jgi:hypothetical protein